jgi:hypothetical protein
MIAVACDLHVIGNMEKAVVQECYVKAWGKVCVANFSQRQDARKIMQADGANRRECIL